jgi:hypothetical protein
VGIAVVVDVDVVERGVVCFISLCAPRVWGSTKSRDEGLRVELVIRASRSHVRGAGA